jgi:hypothetical protein
VRRLVFLFWLQHQVLVDIKPVAIKETSTQFTTASSPSSETSFTALVHVEKLVLVRLLPRRVL